MALSAQALCLFGIQLLPHYASHCFRAIISFIIQASKKWSNIVNFIPNLIKNAEFSYNFEVQKKIDFTQNHAVSGSFRLHDIIFTFDSGQS